ncbi:MAG: acyltransferase [Aquabacterium sp.]|uniref:acyltransferase family protein n=1 Tax=Aquabacterium sp. TaxID=1872578 RepID=UPI0025C5CCAA|nr:acyltransferase [Aquabacterium sp.]MBI3382744.1 acyltransferase [Aquabacterium sp.]
MASSRYHQIDLLRSVACVMVVAFHYLYRGHLGGWIPFDQPLALQSVVKFGYLGVPLFFSISGFVIFLSAQKASARAFVASRAARLYPAFWMAIILTTLVVRLGGDATLMVPWRDVLINFTMLTHWFGADYVDWAYWSLAVELHFYILIWLLLRFNALQHIVVVMAVWLFISLVNWIRPMYPVDFVLEARWAPFFCLGICSYLMRGGNRSVGVHALFFMASALSLAYIYSQAAHMSEFDRMDVWVAVLIGSAVPLLFWLISRQQFELAGGSVLWWAGALTYPVYLLHEYIGYVLIKQFYGMGIAPILCSGLVFVLVLFLAYLVHVRVERPLSAVIRRVVAGA